MRDPHDVIIRPVLTEKSYADIANKKYVFIVASDAKKTEIKDAVEKVFEVKVERVNTINMLGKMKRQGATQGRRPSEKKAYVTLTKDSKVIEFFEGTAH